MNVPLAQSIVSFHKLAGIPCKYKISPNDQQCHICDFSLSLHIVKNDPYTTKLASKLDCHFIVMVTKIIDAQLKVHKLENVSVKIWSDGQTRLYGPLKPPKLIYLHTVPTLRRSLT